MGMNSLANDLKTLEINAKSGTDPDQYPELVNRFIEQVTLTATELEAYAKTFS